MFLYNATLKIQFTWGNVITYEKWRQFSANFSRFTSAASCGLCCDIETKYKFRNCKIKFIE